MKRKVLRVGRSSLAVSLPRQFVETNRVDSGQEIDVAHHGASLIVKCDKPRSIFKEVDLSDLKTDKDIERLMDKILGALFRQGLDKFTLVCPNSKKSEIVRKILRNGKLNMYEEPGMSDRSKITIHCSITHFDEKALANMTQVVIKQIYRNFDEFADRLKNKKLTREVGFEISSRDKIINEQTDICKRIINKDVMDYRSTTVYSFVDKLEKIGDEVKNLVTYSANNLKMAEKYLDIIEQIKEFFYMLFSASTSFSVRKIDSFYDAFADVLKQLNKCKDVHLYYHCRNIISLIADAYSNLMVGYL